MCLKLSFSYSKWVLRVILSLTVLSNCVSVNLNFDTPFLDDFCDGQGKIKPIMYTDRILIIVTYF